MTTSLQQTGMFILGPYVKVKDNCEFKKNVGLPHALFISTMDFFTRFSSQQCTPSRCFRQQWNTLHYFCLKDFCCFPRQWINSRNECVNDGLHQAIFSSTMDSFTLSLSQLWSPSRCFPQRWHPSAYIFLNDGLHHAMLLSGLVFISLCFPQP